MEKELLNFKSISEYNEALGVETLHPLVSIIDLSKAKPMRHMRHTFGFYSVYLKDEKNCDLLYGRRYYDYRKDSVLFMAPGQVIGVEDNGEEFQPKGWALLFHPDLIAGTPLNRMMKEYTFFSYEANEALHLSGREREVFMDGLHKIQDDMEHSIGRFSKRLIVSNIGLLLDYCLRFYERQFITRHEANNDIIAHFEALLNCYFEGGTAKTNGMPSVKYCASELCLSPNYFGDLIKKETGRVVVETIIVDAQKLVAQHPVGRWLLLKRLLLMLMIGCGLTLEIFADAEAQRVAKEVLRIAKAPLFRDPIHDGAADPMVIYNEREKAWYMFYTNRRANVSTQGTNWCYGTSLGVATSTDNGKNWEYVGALDLEFERGKNTFWAPHVVYDKGVYHLFVTYVKGVHESWSGIGRIAHYTSKNLWKWELCGLIPLADNDPLLDATVYKKADGKWGMWYKNSRIGYTVEAVSDDLYHWKNVPGITISDVPHEAPFVFYYKQYYWMLIDQWNGFGVYRSADAEKWEKQSVILGKKGERKDDNVRASHPGVVVAGDKAYVFYFTHPGWEKEGGWGDETGKLDEAGVLPYIYRRSSIQVAELKVDGAGVMTCDRDAPFDFYLPNASN